MPRKKRYYSLPEEMSKDIWEDEEAFYDDLEEAWSWYSPTSSYNFIQDPTAENFAKAAWLPTLSLGTYMGFNYAMLGHGGMPHLSYWSANIWQSRVSAMRWVSGGLATGARYGARFVTRLVTAGSNPLFMITASTAAHAYTSSEIEKMQPGGGAKMSLATQYAVTGQMTGGSMPVTGLPSRREWDEFWSDIFD